MIIQNNLQLPELVEKLREFEALKMDLVVDCNFITMKDGVLQVGKNANHLQPVAPSMHMHRQIAEKLQIPFKYYEKMQAEYGDLLDHNVTAWFLKNKKNYLLRTYCTDGGAMEGRALLSDSYKMIDHLDILMTTLQAVKEMGIEGLTVDKADITETSMYVRFINPASKISAPEFLKSYRNPETMQVNDGVVSGFVLKNSETGQGAFQVAPRLVVLACNNGMIVDKDAYKRTHLGAKLEEGAISWSADTKDSNITLVKHQIKDYVKHFSSKEYLQTTVDSITEAGAVKLENPVNAVKNATKFCGLSEAAQNDVLSYFTGGGDTNASGVAQAVTYYAHKQPNPDLRFELESKSVDVLKNMPAFDKPSLN